MGKVTGCDQWILLLHCKVQEGVGQKAGSRAGLPRPEGVGLATAQEGGAGRPLLPEPCVAGPETHCLVPRADGPDLDALVPKLAL